MLYLSKVPYLLGINYDRTLLIVFDARCKKTCRLIFQKSGMIKESFEKETLEAWLEIELIEEFDQLDFQPEDESDTEYLFHYILTAIIVAVKI